jgi:DNA-binding response OmpR family regulator
MRRLNEALSEPPEASKLLQMESKSLESVSSPGKILIVEDNADMCKTLQNALSPHWAVRTTTDGEAALQTTQEEKFDLVLSGVMVPKIDGYQLVKTLRNDSKTQELPVMLLSPSADEESRLQGLRLGADDYIVKPFSSPELVERVSSPSFYFKS